MADQLRYDCVGCDNNPVIETPNIDWLASEGTVFDGAYSPSPSCIPARACLWSGMTPWNAGILGMGQGQHPMGVNFPHTIAGQLAREGYYAKGVGKMHFFPQRALNGFHSILLDESGRVEDRNFESDYLRWFRSQKGMDVFPDCHGIGWNSWMSRPWPHDERIHPTVWTVNEALRFLNDKDPSMPYFLHVSFARPHSPYDPPQYYFDMYDQSEVPEPSVGSWAEEHDVPVDGAYADAWRGKRSSRETARARKAYYGQVSHIDNQIGRIITWLKENRELDNTLFLFTSDHGDMLGDHHLWRKTYAYEGSAHIPLIVKLPKAMRDHVAERCGLPVSLYDIFPTICDVVQADIPAGLDGQSLLPLIRGKDAGWRRYIHGEHSQCYAPEQEMQFITDGRYKYIWFPKASKEQFFDLENDPGEQINRIDDAAYGVPVAAMRKELTEVLEARGSVFINDHRLFCVPAQVSEISPLYARRLETSDYDWMNQSTAVEVKI